MHNEIKTYQLIDQDHKKTSFSIKTMEELFHANHADKPHRHDYYTIVLVKSASGVHFIDFKEYSFTNNCLFFIQPGQVHQILTDEEPKGWTITFTEGFLLQSGISCQLLNDIYLLNDYEEFPPLNLHDHEMQWFQNIIDGIVHFQHQADRFKYEALGSLLKLFLIQSNNLCTLSPSSNSQIMESGNQLLRHFKGLVEQQFRNYHKVNEYASQLAVTPDHLNKTVKALTGKSAKTFIGSRIITEAKRILLFTDSTNKELAFELGFEEPSHFNSFFKRSTGLTPSLFREESRNA